MTFRSKFPVEAERVKRLIDHPETCHMVRLKESLVPENPGAGLASGLTCAAARSTPMVVRRFKAPNVDLK